jgi:protein-S-isoprenylcysteine O-methyltransferase Ste14
MIIYCFLHSALATTASKRVFTKATGWPQAVYRLLYNLFAIFTLAGIIVFLISINSVLLYKPGIPGYMISVFLCISGLMCMAVCIIKYFRQMSGLWREAQNKRLEVSGIHRFVRHPLYSATFLFLIAIAGAFPFLSIISVIAIMIIYTLIGIHFEEIKLVHRFGEDYIRYQQDTPMLIPGWKKKVPV